MRRALSLALIIVFGLVVSWSQWRGHDFNVDMVPYAYQTEALIANGTMPTHGAITSYGGYAPPGTSWLLWPGMVLFRDTRLLELPGAVLLYTLTTIGVYALARAFLPVSAALLCAGLWALSSNGQYFATSLWPTGHAVFYVWVTVFSVWWHQRRRTEYLGAALLVYAVGMFVFMSIAFALLVPLAIGVVYRPPIKVSRLLPFVLCAVLVWLPYADFEAGRGFVDVLAQFGRHSIVPTDYRLLWCNPSLMRASTGPPPSDWDLIRYIALIIVTAGAALVLFRRYSLLVVALLIVLAPMVLLLEQGRYERLWGLWAVQTVLIVALLWRRNKTVRYAFIGLFAVMTLLGNYPAGSIVRALEQAARYGYGGLEQPSYTAIRAFAADRSEHGVTHVAVGYEIDLRFEPQFHAIDPMYKTGMDFDYILHRMNITNTDQCAEGMAAKDDYRLVAGMVIPFPASRWHTLRS